MKLKMWLYTGEPFTLPEKVTVTRMDIDPTGIVYSTKTLSDIPSDHLYADKKALAEAFVPNLMKERRNLVKKISARMEEIEDIDTLLEKWG